MSERIATMAKVAAALPEPHRRQSVLGLMRERYRSILSATDPRAGELPCTEAEVFYAGYGDANGREYWSAWLFPGKATADQIAWLIAAHASCSAEQFERVRAQLVASLAAIADQPARTMAEHLVADPGEASSLTAFRSIAIFRLPPTSWRWRAALRERCSAIARLRRRNFPSAPGPRLRPAPSARPTASFRISSAASGPRIRPGSPATRFRSSMARIPGPRSRPFIRAPRRCARHWQARCFGPHSLTARHPSISRIVSARPGCSPVCGRMARPLSLPRWRPMT